jgi:flagellin
MAMVVNSNPVAMNALGNLNNTQRGLSKTFENISSGLRINNAADDAAGLAVAENLESEQMSLRQAQRNTNDGISVIQTAEGATNEVADMLKRMRELAVQSSSETLANSERAYIQDEFVQLSDEVDRILKSRNSTESIWEMALPPRSTFRSVSTTVRTTVSRFPWVISGRPHSVSTILGQATCL